MKTKKKTKTKTKTKTKKTAIRAAIPAAALLAAIASPAAAHAQEVTRMPDATRQALGLDTGLENAFVVRATYTHRVDLGALRETRLYGRFTLPFVTPDLGDWGIDGGLRANVLAWRDVRLAVLAGPLMKRNTNDLFTAYAFGLGATMLAGYEGPVWGLSAELGYEQLLATHIDHSSTYREVAFPDAKDGWYALSGSSARAGLRGGARIGSVELFARAGLNTTGQLHSITPPFYAGVGTAYAF